jgi:two-component system nitrate/nitrite response regulator NarL
MKWLVVDDDSVLRSGLITLLTQLESGTVVLETDDVDYGLRLTQEHSDLTAIVVNLLASGGHGEASLRDFVQSALSIPIIVLSSSENPEDVIDALVRGARGYLPKSASPHTIQAALRLILGGDIYVPPLLLHGAHTLGVSKPWAGPTVAQISLTHRQRMVLHLLCGGLSNKAICHRLDVSEKTVKAHVSSIFKSLRVANRTQAARAALDAGLIDRHASM